MHGAADAEPRKSVEYMYVMNGSPIGRLALVALSSLVAVPAPPQAQSPVKPDLVDVDNRFAPSPAHPFGRPNPDAPPELAQFAFFIGEFDCVDTMRQPDGKRVSFPAIWNARYFLNGFGIQDQYWTPRFFTSNIRIFDPESEMWKVTFFRMPGYQSSRWEGKKVGDEIQIRNEGRTDGPALTFHNIGADGFDWHSGGEDPGWASTCKRRHQGAGTSSSAPRTPNGASPRARTSSPTPRRGSGSGL